MSPARPQAPAATPRRWDLPRGGATAADGIVLVDKHAAVTSHDVVAMTRRMAATRKVGHAGTLDPMATGLLVLGVGRATRFLTYLVGADKAYRATVRLGQETVTEDAEGEVVRARGARAAEVAECLEPALDALTGEIMQVPSAVSAIKVDGVRSYTRVRQGEDVELPARPVTIHSLTRQGGLRQERASDGTVVVDLDLTVSCSSGTYVRALARDLGVALGCGAHLTALRRTVVGPFDVSEAATVERLAGLVEADAAADRPQGMATLSLSEVARRCFPVVSLSEAEARAVGYGQLLPVGVMGRAVVPPRAVVSKAGGTGGVAAGFAPDGQVVALLTSAKDRTRPLLVLTPSGGTS
ncbi:tRNA pseudouridine(55) synthase TruB [Actinomyces faecalis]|uniref:tRNA pseudouridine(55) synthase TruB n=1 Tax=Actinomyces faecalis TaxID=2722820 RepID=UPI001555E3AF|nr:tRNA pseudouridine(55) synthase TruB [Actinomyces faecalis]